MLSPVEEEGEEAGGVNSLAGGRSLLLATVSGRLTGVVSEAGKGSSGSTVAGGSDTGVFASSLSKEASGCTTPGEEDFWTTGSNFSISSEKRARRTDCFRIQPVKVQITVTT